MHLPPPARPPTACRSQYVQHWLLTFQLCNQLNRVCGSGPLQHPRSCCAHSNVHQLGVLNSVKVDSFMLFTYIHNLTYTIYNGFHSCIHFSIHTQTLFGIYKHSPVNVQRFAVCGGSKLGEVLWAAVCNRALNFRLFRKTLPLPFSCSLASWRWVCCCYKCIVPFGFWHCIPLCAFFSISPTIFLRQLSSCPF